MCNYENFIREIKINLLNRWPFCYFKMLYKLLKLCEIKQDIIDRRTSRNDELVGMLGKAVTSMKNLCQECGKLFFAPSPSSIFK